MCRVSSYSAAFLHITFLHEFFMTPGFIGFPSLIHLIVYLLLWKLSLSLFFFFLCLWKSKCEPRAGPPTREAKTSHKSWPLTFISRIRQEAKIDELDMDTEIAADGQISFGGTIKNFDSRVISRESCHSGISDSL